MYRAYVDPVSSNHSAHCKAVPPKTEEPPAFGASRPNILALHRLVGNQAIRRLMSQGRLSAQGIYGRNPVIPRCSYSGTCVASKGQGKALRVSAARGDHVQRFWGDKEEEAKGDRSGGLGRKTAEEGGSRRRDPGEEGGEYREHTSAGGDETGDAEEANTLPEVDTVSVECDTDKVVGFGDGKGRSFSLHGETTPNYSHGKPIPQPFPPGVIVTTSTVGKAKIKLFSATGTFDATFVANPSVKLPNVPPGLRPCQQAAVQDFINGPLAAHEQDHVDAIKNNYDGTVTVEVNVSNIIDTPTMRQRAMENPVNAEDRQRTAAANKASKALDPWRRTIPGLGCKD